MKSRANRSESAPSAAGSGNASAAVLVNSAWMEALFGRIAFAFSRTFVVNDARLHWMRGDKLVLAAIIVMGAIVRLWGLGAVGLHGEDEHTTTLAAMHIFVDGTPRFPSGMFYSRAIAQSYLIAASVFTFGESEWAIRLPSALCGVLLIALAYCVGRRFLQPVWNLTFVATVALSPELILVSQNARMYVFFIAVMAGYMALIFRWERTWRLRDLCWVVLTMIIALQFQILAVFGILLLFFPPLVHGDVRRLRQAIAAAVVCALAYFVIDRWNGSFYFERAEEFGRKATQGPNIVLSFTQMSTTILFAMSVAAIFVSWWGGKGGRTAITRGAVSVLFLIALGAQLTFNYHIAALAYLGAFVIAKRDGQTLSRFSLPLIMSGAVVVYHWFFLRHVGVQDVRLMVGAVLGKPSVWAYFNFAKLSYVAAAIAAVGAAYALVEIARNRRVADYWWLFFLGVWIPLLVIGVFQWYPAPRYTIGCFVPLLVCAFATTQDAMGALTREKTQSARLLQSAVALVAVALAINPIAFGKAIDPGYDTHPDHKGAAEFIKSRLLRPGDRVLAEDVLMQTYYLKHVDYWLVARPVAAPFVEKLDDKYVDGYTHTPVIASGAELQTLVDRPNRGALYVITSAEEGGGAERYMEGDRIYETLRNGSFQKVFVGRDGRTFVWMSPPRASAEGVGSK